MSVQFGPVMQHGYIVADVENSAREWAERVGAGPFYVLDRNRMDEYYFRGVRMDVEVRLAFGYWHGIQVELIQPLDAGESLYRQALRNAPGQLNHMATIVTGLDGLLARHGLQQRIIQRGNMSSGVKFAYLEEYLPGGHHLELIDAPASTLLAFTGMEQAARHWDGRNPIRPMSAVAADLAR